MTQRRDKSHTAGGFDKPACEEADKADVAGVLLCLKENLPDKLLENYFPDQPVSVVRACLNKAVHYLESEADVDGDPSLYKHSSQPLDSSVRHLKTGSPFAGESSSDNGTVPKEPLSIFTDGASRGNPGEAGAGVQILDADGEEIFVTGRYLGNCTNNMAEYQALLLGLVEAERIGARSVAFCLDSELIVRQIQGIYKVKNKNLKPLFSEAMTRLAAFDSWHIRHVPRSENQRADQLANMAIDEKMV